MGLGGTLPAVLIAVLFTQFFWWFGIHGTLVVNAVIDPIMNALAIENYEAYKAGAEQLPHIINTTFMGVFVNQGMQLGSRLRWHFLIARSIRMKKLMKTVIAPSVFNVSGANDIRVADRIEPDCFLFRGFWPRLLVRRFLILQSLLVLCLAQSEQR